MAHSTSVRASRGYHDPSPARAVEPSRLVEARSAAADSNLVSDRNSSAPQPGAAVDAGRLLVPVRPGERSLPVPLFRRTSYCSGASRARHSSSVIARSRSRHERSSAVGPPPPPCRGSCATRHGAPAARRTCTRPTTAAGSRRLHASSRTTSTVTPATAVKHEADSRSSPSPTRTAPRRSQHDERNGHELRHAAATTSAWKTSWNPRSTGTGSARPWRRRAPRRYRDRRRRGRARPPRRPARGRTAVPDDRSARRRDRRSPTQRGARIQRSSTTTPSTAPANRHPEDNGLQRAGEREEREGVYVPR